MAVYQSKAFGAIHWQQIASRWSIIIRVSVATDYLRNTAVALVVAWKVRTEVEILLLKYFSKSSSCRELVEHNPRLCETQKMKDRCCKSCGRLIVRPSISTQLICFGLYKAGSIEACHVFRKVNFGVHFLCFPCFVFLHFSIFKLLF